MKFLPVLLGLGLTLTQGLAVAAGSSQRPVEFDLPPQALSSALNAFAQQSDLRVVFYTDVAEGMKSPEVRGSLTPESALKILLATSDLKYEFSDDTVTIWSGKEATARGNQIRLAEGSNRSNASALGSQSTESASSGESSGGPRPLTPESPDPTSPPRGIPEVLVKGTRALNTDIERSEDGIQPYVVFSAEEMKRTPATNLEEFFRTQLSMNSSASTNNQSASSFQGNQSVISLRGLSSGQTLILLNGRRLPSALVGTAFAQPDINAIPLKSIERIEVLPSTAGGQYGGGATGGVINIITRQDYEGIEATFGYGDTFSRDSVSRRFNVAGGLSLENGRSNIVFSAGHSDNGGLITGRRDFAADARALQLKNNPSAFSTSTTPPLGAAPNIRNSTNANLRLKAGFGGTVLSAPYTTVPNGYRGPLVDGVAGLVANAGTYNLDLPEDQNGAQRSLLGETETSSIRASARRQFSDHVDTFIDLLWSRNESRSSGTATPSTVTLQPTAPNNPFTTAINVSFPTNGIAVFNTTDLKTLNASAGFIVRLPRDWVASADYTWSEASYGNSRGDLVIRPAGTSALQNGTLDVLSDVPLDFSSYLFPQPASSLDSIDSVATDANVRLSGPLLRLPGGPIVLSALMERRELGTRPAFDEGLTAAGAASITFIPRRSQDVDSYYAEMTAPLFGAQFQFPGLRNFELLASARHDRYETRSPRPSAPVVPSVSGPFPDLVYTNNEVNATRSTFGFRYSPVADVTLRASRGTGFLPPSVSQIQLGSGTTASAVVVDPKRGNISASTGPITIRTGGNPDLLPEDSTSISVGLILTPRILSDLRLSLDYTRIEKSREIATSVASQTIIDLEDSLAGRVTRAPLTTADAALGYTGGAITAIDQSALNLSNTLLTAYDLQADYLLRLASYGDLRLFAMATYQPDYNVETLPGAGVRERVGFVDGPLKWRGNGGLIWTRRSLSLGWNAQYFHHQNIYSSTATASTVAAAILRQGSAEYPSQVYHDAFVEYRTSGGLGVASLLDNLAINLSVQNVFDKEPPIVAGTAPTDGYRFFGDPRLRRFSLSITKSF